MTLLHHHGHRQPFDDPPEPAAGRELELLAERRQLCTTVAELRAANHDLRVELDRAHRELAHAHRLLAKRWWQR